MSLAPLIPSPDDLKQNAPRLPGLTPIKDAPAPPSADVRGMGMAPLPALPEPSLRSVVNGSPRAMQEQNLQSQISHFESPDPQQPGFWHKLGHIAARVGNIAGDIVAPSTMSMIPGTDLNNSLRHGANVRELAGLQNEDRQDQDTERQNQDAASKRTLEGAQTADTEAQTQERENPPEKPVNWEHLETDQGIFARNPQTNQLMPLTFGGKPLMPKQPPQKDEPLKTIQIQVGGKPHQMGWNDQTQRYDVDMGESGEKPPTVRVETAGEERGAKNDLLKAYQPTLDSAERMNVMTESYEKAVKDHDQQAMLNLLANHLGMTMGLQKGSRMTKDIITEAVKSQPWLAGMESKFDKDGYLSGVTLSPNQMRQMVGLGQERYAEDVKKSRSTAQYLGAKDDGPERVPGKATINYYLGQAGGDPAKAKALAAQDGWTISR